MSKNGFAFLAVVFLLFSGVVFSYSNLGGGWCGCNSCGDCTLALNDSSICGTGVRADGSVMNSGTPICINNPVNLSGGKIFDLNGTVLNGIHGATTGIYLHTNNDFIIRNGGITGFTDYGMILFNVTYAKVYNMTINDTGPNAGAGIALGVATNADAYDSYSTIYNCSIIDNGASTVGLWVRYCDENEIYDSDLSRNALAGLWLDSSQDNYVHDSVADSTTGASGTGFSCLSAVDRRSSGNTFLRVNASNNNWAGLIAMRCQDSTVNNSRFLSNSVVGVGISLANEGVTDHRVTVVNSYFNGNNYGIYVDDYDSDPRSMCTFQNNTIRFSIISGMFLNNTNNNTISSNRVNSGFWGITMQNSQDNNLSDNTIDAVTGIGLAVVNTTNTRANNTHFYQNLYDLFVSAPSQTQQVYLYNLIFDSNGAYADYSNVSIVDSLASGTGYTATWVPAHATPGDTISFENKFINISTFAGSPSLDQVTWYWSDSELPGYMELQFELWEYSVGTWTVRNATPNVASNSLVLYNLNPASDYAILQNLSECPVINESGAYQLQANLVGAPNPVSGPSGLNAACVIIESSNVYLDCNAHTIQGNGIAAAAGILLNGTSGNPLTNITLLNCPVGNYTTAAAFAYYADNSSLENITAYNNSQGTGIYIEGCKHTNLSDSTAYGNAYGIGLAAGTQDGTFSLNRAYNNTWWGFRIDNADSNRLEGNWAYNCTNGFVIISSNNNNFSSNTAYNNSQLGISIDQSNNTNATDTHLFNNAGGDLRADNTGATARTVYFTNLTIDSPAGDFTNYTSLDISDLMEANSEYIINWTANQYALPGTSGSFRQKFVKITESNPFSIDTVTWRWLASEEAGYTPSLFRLMKYNSSNQWETINWTADTAGRRISASNLDRASEYGILQFLVNMSTLKIDQTVSQPSPGGIVEFNITMNNTGNITLDTITLWDTLPAGLTFADSTPAPDASAPPLYTWNSLGPIDPGDSTSVILHATVDDGVVYPGNEIVNLTNYARAAGYANSMLAIVLAEDYENATIYYANVSILKTDITALPPSPGGIVEYQIDVTNIGNVTLDPVGVVDTLPAEFTYSNADPLPDTAVGDVLTWNNVGPIAPGATATILLNATVDSGTPGGVYTNTADAEGQPPNGDNVTASDDVDVGVLAAAIDVVKAASRYALTVGQKVTFNLTITNTGQANLTVYAQDTLPAELAYVVGEADPLPTLVAGQVLYWDAIIAVLEPGETFNITYNSTVVSAGTGVVNDVLVTGVPSGDNVTDTAFVTLTTRNPSSDGGLKPLDIDVDPNPTYVGNPTLITVTSGGDEVNNADLTIRVFYGSSYVYYYLTTDSSGEFEFIPEHPGEHRVEAEKSGYMDAQEYFSVLAIGECMETTECVDLYGECYVCSVHRDPAYNECVLAEGAQCGVNDKCPPATECQETEDIMCPEPDSIPICIDCRCEWVECLTNADCDEGEQCTDYECTGQGGGEEPPEGSCETNGDCADSQYCDDGECTDLNCVCGYALNHACVFYECCSDAVCERMYGIDYFCNMDEHECEQEPEVPADQPIEVDVPDETPVGEEVTITVTSGGDPVEGAQVTVTINGRAYSAGTTDSNGQVKFTPKEAGQYAVEAQKPGFGSGQDNFQASSEGMSLTQIAAIILAPLLLLGLLGALYIFFFAKKKKRKFKEDSED